MRLPVVVSGAVLPLGCFPADRGAVCKASPDEELALAVHQGLGGGAGVVVKAEQGVLVVQLGGKSKIRFLAQFCFVSFMLE